MMNLSIETMLIIVSFLVNLVAIGMLVLHMAKDGRVKDAGRQGNVDEDGLKALVAHLEDLVMECERVSKNLCSSISSKEEDCKDLLRRMELKKEAIIAQYAGLRKKGRFENVDDVDVLFDEEVTINNAERVRMMAESGVSEADIAHRLQIPVGEVRLMLSLQRQ